MSSCEHCVCCGAMIPEGRQVCNECEGKLIHGCDECPVNDKLVVYDIPEGHGRGTVMKEPGGKLIQVFWYDEEEMKVGDEVPKDVDMSKWIPIFGVFCESPQKARVLADWFNAYADALEKFSTGLSSM